MNNDEEKQNSNISETPSTSSDVMPGGGATLGQAASQGAKNATRKGIKGVKNAIGRGLKALWNLMPIQVKIVVIVIIVIAVVICSLLLLGMISEGSDAVSGCVDEYIENTAGLDGDAKDTFDTKSSLIRFKLSDINSMYDSFIASGKGGAETQNLMKYKIGTNNVSDQNSRIVNVDDKVEVYKHILMAEKYNFNKVKWKKYTHSDNLGKDVSSFKENKDLGLKYPDTSKNSDGTDAEHPIDMDKFIDLTLPYLQTWYIPLGMSNASIINGKEYDSNRAPAFSYNIIKEAYHNITSNWYELKKYTEVTKYKTYKKNTCNDYLDNVIVKENRRYKYNSSTSEYEYDRSEYTLDTSHVTSSTEISNVVNKDTSHVNDDANARKDPMREERVSTKNEFSSQVYIKTAEVFDAKIINEFNYRIYSDSDARNRKNPNSSSETTSNFSMPTEHEENQKNNAISNLVCDPQYGTLSLPIGSIAQMSIVERREMNFDTSIGGTTQYDIVYRIKLGDYIDYTDEKIHNVTRIWQDTLSQQSSETSAYTIDDLVAYNESSDRKEKVSATELCGQNAYSSNSNSGSGSVSTAPTTSFELNGHTFPVYNQNIMSGNISSSGCGLCAITVVIDTYKNRNYNPETLGNEIGWNRALYTKQYADILNNYGFSTSVTTWGDGGTQNENISLDRKKQITREAIDRHLRQKKPVIVQVKGNAGHDLGSSTNSGHYIVLAGYQDNKIIIANSAGGYRNEVDMDTLLSAMYDDAESDHGFMLIDPDGGSFSNGNSNNTNNSNNSNNSSSSSSTTRYGSVADAAREIVNEIGGGRVQYDTPRSWNGFSSARYECASFCSEAIYRASHKTLLANSQDSVNGLGSAMLNDPNNFELIYYYPNEVSIADISGAKNTDKDVTSLIQPGDIVGTYSNAYTFQHAFIYLGGNEIAEMNIAPYNVCIRENFNYSKPNIKYIIRLKDSGSGSGSSSSSSGITCHTKSGKYYTDIMKNDGLNLIDFMNSNPDIYQRYIRSGAQYLDYVGYSRSKLTFSYWNLKKLFTKVNQKHGGTLPFAYGKTLGFDNIYGEDNSNNQNLGSGMFIWPVPEYVEAGLKINDQLTATFAGNDSVHNGNHGAIDISHSVNTSAKIVAAASGKVIHAGDDNNGYGNYVIIDHLNGYYTLYGHMAPGSIRVSEGDSVNSGQQIGVMGTTGNSTGNHLHFEVRTGGSTFADSQKIDPLQFFNDDCSPIGGGSSDATVSFVWEQEGNDDYLRSIGWLVDNDQYYVIQIDSYNHRTRCVGHGIDLDAGGYAAQFEAAGYPTSVGSKVPKAFVDNLSKQVISERRNEIASKTSGLNLKSYQIDALVSRSYQMGPSGWYDGNNWGYAPGVTFNSAYTRYWKKGDESSTPNYNHPLYVNFMRYTTDVQTRREREWKLFQTGSYN